MTLLLCPRRRRVRFTLVAAAMLAAASLPIHAAESGGLLQRIGLVGLQGSGKLQTEPRAVGSFQAIDLHASMNLVLR